jgi:hypothetical protein
LDDNKKEILYPKFRVLQTTNDLCGVNRDIIEHSLNVKAEASENVR